MKTYCVLVSILIATALPAAEEFKVPERTPTQRINRLLTLDFGEIAMAIGYAKSKGSTVDAYARYCGEQYAPTWNKDAGFAGFARGTLANFDIFRRDEDPAIEILAQSPTMLRFKSPLAYKRGFKDGKLFGTTLDEYARWLDGIYQVIAARLDCTYKQEMDGNDFLIITVAKK